MKKNPQFIYFTKNLISNYSAKKLFFTQQNFFGLESILEDMYFIGIISGFTKKLNNFEIFLKYSAFGQKLLFNAKNYYKQSFKKSVKVSQVKSLSFVEPFSFLFLLTAAKGIVLKERSISTRNGGIFLAKIK